MAEPIQAADPESALRVAQEALAHAMRAVGELERQLDAQGRLRPVKTGRYRVNVAKPRAKKDKDKWCLRIYGPGISAYGRRERTEVPYSRATKAKAQGLARRREAELNDEGKTLLEVFELWRAGRNESKLSPHTTENHDSAQRCLESSSFAGLVDGELSCARVLAMRDELSQGRKTSTAKLYLGLVAQAWRWAFNREQVSQPWPTGLPKWRAPVADRTRKNAYTPDELYGLLSHLASYRGGHYLGLGWFLAETAARVRASLKLQVGDVTLRPDGSGDVALGRGEDKRTKTGVERRAVISPALAEQLDLSRPADAPLFPSAKRSGQAVAYVTFGGIVRAWLDTQGLKGLRDVHSLRRRGVCELTRADVPVEKGRRITGHRSREVYQGYAECADYDLSAERRILWVDPKGIWAQCVPNALENPAQMAENSDMAAASPRTCSGSTGLGQWPRGLQGLERDQIAGPYLRAQLLRRPALPYVAQLLRASFGGAAVE